MSESQPSFSIPEATPPEAYGLYQANEHEAFWRMHTEGIKAIKRLNDADPALEPESRPAVQVALTYEAALSTERAATAEANNRADRDVLTGLYTRRVLEREFDSLSHNYHKRRTDLPHIDIPKTNHSLLIFDVDHFKAYNDTYGHVGGDQALRGVAETIKQSVRSRDVPVRYGGEEMAVLLPNASEEDAAELAERIRETIERKGHVTVSCGVSELDLTKDLSENVAVADAALYYAKENGRNQVVAAADQEERLASSYRDSRLIS